MTSKANFKIKNYQFDPYPHRKEIKAVLLKILALENPDQENLRPILKQHLKNGKDFFSKDELIAGYRLLISEDEFEPNPQLEDKLRMKPTRTISGVATVTVLTKPFPCPGKCIFCPNDVRMPKSYMADEPGAQRAERNHFDPYLQTFNRLSALRSTGHNVTKVELIVLGGTWSFYPEKYQIWFIKECFRAMNDFGVKDARAEIENKNFFEEADKIPARTADGRLRSYNEIIGEVENGQSEALISDSEMCEWPELENEQKINETATSRCVGLVIETRPDYIDEREVIKIRRLGATKVQIGIQSLQDEVMMKNLRGHGKAETINAIRLLRLGGFKIHAHWMPNLYGSDVQKDIEDYDRLWEKEVAPDELKIYPTSIIDKTQLFDLYKQGKYTPYTYDELMEVLSSVMPRTPRYCRLTRVIRDIPSTDIVAGNKLTNFRQIAESEIVKRGGKLSDIRAREVKARNISIDDVEVEVIQYESTIGTQFFISYKTIIDDKICGFLRLSLPEKKLIENHFMAELSGKAMIREVHVYGQVVGIGNKKVGKSQHLGLGHKLVAKACEIASENGYEEISVISAIGTKEYYKKLGFSENGLYMDKKTA